ncbi:Transcriptional regulator GlxA family, contains an amidase domain and an AraC-type DNA-binding HTH domain [Enhydrobacter aerosaccus]|uniref:Transcriptional regulator GlxA family, contains an amidase domain and an AraC-type DNA-binding HTH domain n=1 Tax=Enhydrobacter aerosaccus TaxID=225324 RepID=A0A1T4NPZ0_9HYPH|nr:GlxA family transcriptional regulator [Enhydrobacter aerosaccus]SJZ81262.1 Transcriptional regulator GlxA family, contains an amidase domain and an AraC-type DNA-binding HTH domain [Enhydrobacter aerosaccus]
MPQNPRIPPARPLSVEILAFPGVDLLDVAGALSVFTVANDRLARTGGLPAYAVRVVADSDPMLVTSAGLGIAADRLPSPRQAVDTLVVAGGPGVYAAADDRRLTTWVRRRATVARRVVSVCTGAFLLGAAGLLEGRRVVTHWTRCAELARRFPKARVESDPIFLQDGAIWTSAGVTAGIDLSLALVEQDLGRPLALDVARQLVVFFKRPGGQAQFSTTLSLQKAEDRFGALNDWIGNHLSEDLSLTALARKAGMSERSFSRHYTAATGLSPARAVERLRLEAARRLLSDTRTPVKRVALRCGFGSEEIMRRSFLRVLGTTPSAYRAAFSLLGRVPN